MQLCSGWYRSKALSDCNNSSLPRSISAIHSAQAAALGARDVLLCDSFKVPLSDEVVTAACTTYSSHAREFTDAIVQVPLRMLTPNLHILVCRFPVQEALRGLVSLELEYFMERYMSDPQRGMRALHAEKNYLNSTEMSRRALLPAAVYHGFRTPDQLQQSCVQQQPRVVDSDPDAAAGSAPFFEMKGTRIRVTSPLARLCVDSEFLVLRLAYIVAQESASGAKRQAQHATKLAALYSVQSAAIAQLQVAACTAGLRR